MDNKRSLASLGQPFPDSQDVSGNLLSYLGQFPAPVDRGSTLSRLGSALATTWPVQMAKSALGAVTLPGDVYAGRVDPMSVEALGRSVDLAGLATLGSGAVPAAKGELRAGIKLRSGAETPETDLAWYFRDVKGKPNLSPAENRRFSAGATTHDNTVVPVRSLVATQPGVNPDFATTSSSAGELPYVFRKGGELFVSDGHHRITKAIHDGAQNVRVRLLDFDAKDTSAPLLDWKPPRKGKAEMSDDDLLRELFGK